MADVIKEFLVSLGFEVDETSFRKFKDGVGISSKDVKHLGLAATGTAVAVAAAVVKISKEYENLYWASQRTGATVTNLQAVSYAASQIGLSADQGKGAIEAMAASMRMNPGLQGLATAYGASAKDPVERLQQLVTGMKKAFGPDGYFAAAMQASNFGIPEPVFFQMWANIDKMKDEADDYKKRVKDVGLNTEETAKNSNELQTSLRRLSSDFDLLGTAISSKFIVPLKDAVDWIDKMIQGAGKITAMSAEQHQEGLKEKREKFRAGVNSWLGEKLFPDLPESERPKPPSAASPMAPRENADSIRLPQDSAASSRAPSGGVDRRNYVADFFMKRGWSKEHAWAITGTLGGETVNFNPSEGGGWIRGKNGQLHKEDSYGVGQWHKERRDTFERVFGHAMKGSSLDEELAFVDWELKNTHKRAGEHLKRTGTPYAGVGVLVPEYEAPADTYGNIRSRGAAAENWFKADLGRRPSASGWGAKTELTDEQAQADTFARNAKDEAPSENNVSNNITVYVNGIQEPEKVGRAVKDALRDATWKLLPYQDTMR